MCATVLQLGEFRVFEHDSSVGHSQSWLVRKTNKGYNGRKPWKLSSFLTQVHSGCAPSSVLNPISLGSVLSRAVTTSGQSKNQLASNLGINLKHLPLAFDQAGEDKLSRVFVCEERCLLRGWCRDFDSRGRDWRTWTDRRARPVACWRRSERSSTSGCLKKSQSNRGFCCCWPILSVCVV